MLQAKTINIKHDSESLIDVVIYESGEYRNPMKIISDYEAMQLSINLACCLRDDRIQMIIDSLTKTLQKGE